MTNNSIKKQIKHLDDKLKAGCQKIPKKTRIILVIIFLTTCGLISLYQTISSFYQVSRGNKVKTEIPVQSHNEAIKE